MIEKTWKKRQQKQVIQVLKFADKVSVNYHCMLKRKRWTHYGKMEPISMKLSLGLPFQKSFFLPPHNPKSLSVFIALTTL